MFKKFSASTDVAGQTILKSSVQRSIRAALLSQWNINADTLEQIWPKKEPLVHVKCREHLSIYTVHNEPLIFQHFDGPFYPTLRLLHKYPSLLPMIRIDRGAIKFLMGGANMMCPGITSVGGYLPPDEESVPSGRAVAIFAEGKEHAVGIGLTKMSTEEMRRINKNIGVENISYLGDDLWSTQKI